MKKVLISLFAAAALFSCSNDELVELNQQAINFGDTFVDNATRADYSSGKTVDAFKVYGTVAYNAGSSEQIFNAANVTREGKTYGEAWSCDVVRYWVPNASYSFAAIVDGEAVATTALPVTINHTVADGDNNKDLLYATASVTTNAAGAPSGDVNGSSVVEFDFEHLLSKMQFTIKNSSTGYSFNVKSISVTGFTNNGVYTIAGKEWAKAAGATNDVTLTFGQATGVAAGGTLVADATRQFLPVNQALAVTITYDILSGSTTIAENAQLTGNIPAQDYVANTVYNVTATIQAAGTIDFTVGTVGGWDPIQQGITM